MKRRGLAWLLISAFIVGGALAYYYWPSPLVGPGHELGLSAQYRIFLHTKRPSPEVLKEKEALSALGIQFPGSMMKWIRSAVTEWITQ